MTLDKGYVYRNSVRHKFNIKSLAEADMVGVSVVLPQVKWNRYLLEDQGYKME